MDFILCESMGRLVEIGGQIDQMADIDFNGIGTIAPDLQHLSHGFSCVFIHDTPPLNSIDLLFKNRGIR